MHVLFGLVDEHEVCSRITKQKRSCERKKSDLARAQAIDGDDYGDVRTIDAFDTSHRQTRDIGRQLAFPKDDVIAGPGVIGKRKDINSPLVTEKWTNEILQPLECRNIGWRAFF